MGTETQKGRLLFHSLGWLLGAFPQNLRLRFCLFPQKLQPLIIIHKDLVKVSGADGAALLAAPWLLLGLGGKQWWLSAAAGTTRMQR